MVVVCVYKKKQRSFDAYVNSGVELFIVLLNVKIVVEHCNTFSAVLTLSVSVWN